ncbi:MAG: acyl-CoA mutase large subunit family protein [Candidatus Magnetomorum sp.]|nr:acyl-CoA mutase large subunit family protein [Candidatus Magnetomorum sp.]
MQKELILHDDFPPHSYEQWCESVEKQLKGAPFARLVKQTIEGIDISPMYFSKDTEALPHMNALPGFSPYVRGCQPTGPVCRSWLVAQEIVYPDPFLTNEALRYDLKRGQTAINLPLDRASKQGIDPDMENASHVGEGGLSVSSYADWAMALKDIPINKMPIFVQTGESGIAITALLIACVVTQKMQAEDISGWIGVDPLGMLAQTGKLNLSLSTIYDEMSELTQWTSVNTPQLKTISPSGIPYHNSGGSAVCESAYVMATAVEYIRALLERGVTIDDICQAMVFQLSIGSDFFMEMAKLRAIRLVWEKIASAFGASETSQKMIIHARTSSYNKTKTDPYVNMLRVTTEAFSAISGGCDSLHVEPFDALLGLPTAFSRRIARNVHIVLRDESHFKHPVDPAGGSWYVEHLTDQLANKIWEKFQDIEKNGGMFAALKKGMVQKNLKDKADERLKNASFRKTVFVGTNKYPNLKENPTQANVADMKAVAKSRAIKVNQFKNTRDMDPLQASLKTFQTSRNEKQKGWFVQAIQAATKGASLAEITQAMRKQSEEAIQIEPVYQHRAAERFENLRHRTQQYAKANGQTPAIFLANMGPIPQHKARADFSTGFFELAAFDVLGNKGFQTIDDAVAALKASGTRITVICSTDDTYPNIVPDLARAIKHISNDHKIIVAGYPKEYIQTFQEAGVDDFIHLKTDALAFLENLQQQMGVTS